MARSAIQETVINTRAGFGFSGPVTSADTVNGNQFTWGPNKLLFVGNTAGTSQTVTITPQSQNLDGFTAPNRAVVVAANSHTLIGPFPSAFAHPEDNDRVWVDVSGSMNIKVYEMTEL